MRGLVVACVVLALACSRGDRKPRKTQLARLPAKTWTIVTSDDATSYAYVEPKDDGGEVVHDGSTGELYAGIAAPTFSPRTHKLFYWARSFIGPGYLVTDGAKLGEFSREGTMVFSPDGTRWATAGGAWDLKVYLTPKPTPAIVLVDGKEVGRYPDASVPSFSPDGQHVAYLVAVDEGGTKLIVDGAERASYPAPDAPCAGRAQPQPKGPNFWPQFQVKYLSDGTLVVLTQDADGWGIYRDGTRIASYQASVTQKQRTLEGDCASSSGIAAWSLTAAESAPVLTWWEHLAGSGESWRVVVDGKPVDDVVCTIPWWRQPPELTPDGRHVSYVCAVKEPEEQMSLVADGRRYGPYRDLFAYAWADDGSHVAYGVLDGPPQTPWRFFVDDAPYSEYFSAIWRPRFEPGTDRLVWEAELERGGKGAVGIGQQRLATFDEIVAGPVFLRRRMVTWVIRRGRRLVRLDVPTH